MLDPKSLESRRDEIAESCRKRRVEADVDDALARYRALNALKTELNEASQKRNAHQKSGKQKMEPEEREAHVAAGRVMKEAVAELEARVKTSQAEFDEVVRELPNFLHPSVPEGGEEDFVTLRTVGEPRKFDFTPRDHLEIAKDLDLVDFESASKVAGQKFYYLKNEAVLLEMAMQHFAVDALIEAGFTAVSTPDLARPEIVAGMGFNPRGEETQIYNIPDHDLCLVATAEITLGGMYADTVFEEADLPIRLGGISHCFRTEAGAAGRESKGLYRVHQFTKTEMFVFCVPEQSEAIHDEILAIEERIFQALELPYRVINVASGDLGAPAYRKYDIEAWMPGRGEGGDWGEVTSASNCTDYQARRLKIRVKRKDGKGTEMVHTLNGTAISNSRCLVPLLENHQQADGSVTIPKALRPYVGRDVIGPR